MSQLKVLFLFLLMSACANSNHRKPDGQMEVKRGGLQEGANIRLEDDRENDDDKNLYLEEVYGESALKWVKAQNLRSEPFYKEDSRFQAIKDYTLQLLDSPDKLIQVDFSGDWAYNFWRDARNPRGLWRRISVQDYVSGQRNWEVLLDVDALAKKEKKNWVFAGSSRFKTRALIFLSDGGKDARSVREFDMTKKQFVRGGFELPEGKHELSWVSEDEIFLGLALGADEVTESGYPRKVRVWRRGENYQSAPVVFEGVAHDVFVYPVVERDEEDGPVRYTVFSRAFDFFNRESYLWSKDKQKIKLDIPTDAEFSLQGDFLYLYIKSDWNYAESRYRAGSLLRLNVQKFLSHISPVDVLFQPTKTQFLQSHLIHKGRVFLILSEDVSHKTVEVVFESGRWRQKNLGMPKNSAIRFFGYSQRHEVIAFSSEGFLLPGTVYAYDLKKNVLQQIDQAPIRFDPKNYTVRQRFVKSKDGTRVPYYIVYHKSLKWNGRNPTIINAYGGFEVSRQPHYSPVIERAWLKNGGVWVLANIRGGGEYGPEWHKAGLKENRQRVYDDFFAVSEDLVRRKVTSPRHLGAVGGSNGGLLMGVALTQRPDLFYGIAIQVPLLDMLRYHKLLAGASWVGEYGSPEDPKMREALRSYSPYHNLKLDQPYPEVIFMTSTADDRVHPGHARRMAAKMEEMGYPFYYYENTEGGHGGSANNEQMARWQAIQFVYFLKMLQ